MQCPDNSYVNLIPMWQTAAVATAVNRDKAYLVVVPCTKTAYFLSTYNQSIN